MLNINTVAPDFKAFDQNGQEHELSDYKGRWVLLYFYPRDNTPGCTKEACAFRDSYAEIDKLGAVVIGVSSNSIASHDKFATKFNLPFTLLADPDKKILKAYEANGLIKRISYLIDPKGKIVKTYGKVKPLEHAQEVKNDLLSLIKSK